jgi:hypothetical protein
VDIFFKNDLTRIRLVSNESIANSAEERVFLTNLNPPKKSAHPNPLFIFFNHFYPPPTVVGLLESVMFVRYFFLSGAFSPRCPAQIFLILHTKVGFEAILMVKY